MKESLSSHLLEVEHILEAKEALSTEEQQLLADIRALREQEVPDAFTEEGEVRDESRQSLAGSLERLMRRMAVDHPQTVAKLNAILTALSRTGI